MRAWLSTTTIFPQQPLQVAAENHLLLRFRQLEHADLENLQTAVHFRLVRPKDDFLRAELANRLLDVASEHNRAGIEINVRMTARHLDRRQVFAPVRGKI